MSKDHLLRKRWLGYDRAQVERTLNELSAEVQKLRADADMRAAEVAALTKQLEQAKARLGSMADELAETADAVDEEGAKVEKRLELARAQIHEIERQAKSHKSVLAWELHSLAMDRERFEADFRELLMEHLRRLDRSGAEPEQPTPDPAKSNGRHA